MTTQAGQQKLAELVRGNVLECDALDGLRQMRERALGLRRRIAQRAIENAMLAVATRDPELLGPASDELVREAYPIGGDLLLWGSTLRSIDEIARRARG